jgi:hypothetical protein
VDPTQVQTVTTWVIVVVWVVLYGVALANADPLPPLETAVRQLVVPPLLWVVATRLVLRHWWSGPGSRMSGMDLPGRLLAVAVAALPERRREWGRAMLAELAEVQGRSARWRFALSSVGAMLWLQPAGGWPVLALVAGVVVASVAAAGPAVGAAVPGLRVFTVTFTGLVGAMVVLAVARSRRPRLRLPVPAPTVLVTGGVAASIAVTVIFLRREPAAAEYLPPPAAVYLAAVLAGCLWIALAAPRWLGTGRLAPHLGAAAVVFAAWFWLANRTDEMEPPLPLVLLLALVLASAPVAAFFVPAFAAGRARSFRSGLQAAVWTVTAMIPLTYAIWLPEGLRRHAIDGRLLIDGEVVAPVGANLADALVFCLGIFPVLGLTLAVIGAGLGARTNHRAVPNDPS